MCFRIVCVTGPATHPEQKGLVRVIVGNKYKGLSAVEFLYVVSINLDDVDMQQQHFKEEGETLKKQSMQNDCESLSDLSPNC